jgi:hypothetical protein
VKPGSGVMKIAYIISAYKYPEQLVRLVSRLNHEAASFLIHVDKKSEDSIYQAAVEGTGHLPNVHFLKRYRCHWGGFGHVQATIEGIKEISRRDIPFDYAILLTGQDYPIKTNERILDFFQQNEGKSFMEQFPLPTQVWEDTGLARVENWHVRWFGRHYVFPGAFAPFFKRSFPRGLHPYGGSSYWCLSRACIEYIDRFIRQNRGYVNFFRTVDVPDEIFFQTILMNSPLAPGVVNDDLRYVEWSDPTLGSPAVLRLEDFERIFRSPKLFARKFDASVDEQVLDRIDRELDFAKVK